MADETKTPPPPLELRPKLRVERLNRATLAVVAIVAILILWLGFWALGRKPAPIAPRPPEQAGRPLDVDRLAQAPSRARPPRAPERSFPPPPAAVVSAPAPRRSVGQVDPEAIRAQKALDASPVVAGFGNPTYYPPAAAAGRGEEAAAGDRADRFPASASLIAPPRAAPRRADGERGPGSEPAADPGFKRRKQAFLEAARAQERISAVPALVQEPLSPYTLWEGAYIPAVLTAGVTSDLPGETTALVRENVYDSRSGRYLLVPSGSRLLGSYDQRIAFGQRRVLVAWHRLIFPDGRSLDLRGMPGADLAGEAGLRDKVDNHFIRTFGQALLLSAFSAGAQLSQPQESSSLGNAPSARQIATAALGQELNRTASLVLRRSLDVEPTLEIRPGKLFFVQLTADLVFSQPY